MTFLNAAQYLTLSSIFLSKPKICADSRCTAHFDTESPLALQCSVLQKHFTSYFLLSLTYVTWSVGQRVRT